MVSEKPWVAQIEQEINNLMDQDPKYRVRCSMFRVPPSVRRVKPRLYSPQIIPFGLYSTERLRNEKMSPMDRLKLEVASVVVKIIKEPYTECFHHYDAALDCLNLPGVTPNMLHPILSDLVSSLSRLPYVSRDSERKLEMMRGRISGLKAMAHAPGYELREREARLLSADLDSCFKVFERFLDTKGSNDNNRANWKWICNKVVGDAKVMDLYDDISEIYDEAARSLLTLDAVFLVGFMLSLHAGSSPESRIQIEELGWFNPVLEIFRQEGFRCNMHVIAFDMWLMENQIPLTMIRNALECMWEVSNQAGSSTDAGKALTILVRHAVKRVLHLVPGDCSKHSTSIDAVPISECKHLLECLYKVVCPSVKTTSSSSVQKKDPRRHYRVNKTSSISTAELATYSSRGDAMRKTKSPCRSLSSSSLDLESRYPLSPGFAALSNSNSLRTNSGSDHPYPSVPLTYRLSCPGYPLYPPTNSSPFPGFPLSAPKSSGQSAASSNKQLDHHQSPSPLKSLPQQQPPLPTSSNGYHEGDPFCSRVTMGLADREHREVDRYRRTNGLLEPAPSSTSWNDSHSLLVNTEDELEIPFRPVPRSPSPLPVSDTMNMDDGDGTNYVEYTIGDLRSSRNNSYSTVTIDLPEIFVGKLRPGGQSNFPIPDSPATLLNKFRTASMKTVRSFQIAGQNWVAAPWRLFQKIFALRGVGLERKISSAGMYGGGRGSATLKDIDFRGGTKPPPVVTGCPMSEIRNIPVPSVTQLRKAGIRCRSGSQVGCKPLVGEGEGFGAFRPTLFLPKLCVDENTERILQNLVVFELVSASEHELMSFLHLMTDLIKSEEDVQMLRKGEKAVLWLTSPVNDFEVITMFSNLLQSCLFTETVRSRDLRKELTHCYTRSWRHSFHIVIDTVCSRSWILISLVAATLMLVALQTVYMLLGYYRFSD